MAKWIWILVIGPLLTTIGAVFVIAAAVMAVYQLKDSELAPFSPLIGIYYAVVTVIIIVIAGLLIWRLMYS